MPAINIQGGTLKVWASKIAWITICLLETVYLCFPNSYDTRSCVHRLGLFRRKRTTRMITQTITIRAE